MSDEERKDLLTIKSFLENAIPIIQQQLVDYSPSDSKEEYQFLIDKAIMYRETLKRIHQQLSQE